MEIQLHMKTIWFYTRVTIVSVVALVGAAIVGAIIITLLLLMVPFISMLFGGA